MTDENQISRLLEVCRGKTSLLILTHNHPDSDSLASAWALKHLLEARAQVSCLIVFGGILAREENRYMNSLLKIRAVPARPSHFRKYPDAALVDCQPGAGNNLFPANGTPLIVIDHHAKLPATRAQFLDIEPEAGSTATILTEYLRSAAVETPPPLATALYYGIVSETQHLGREVTRRDIEAATFLFPLVKHQLISRIEHPRHGREFFQQLHHALEQAFSYKSFVGARLHQINHPGFVAQFADLLLSLRRSTWCLVSGRYRDTIFLSLRTTRSNTRAGRILRKAVEGKGSAGGHDMIAGAQIPLKGMAPDQRDTIEETVFKNLMKEIGLPETINPTPLVDPPAIYGTK
jgi:nanoRNase/pAp phosphatase (c-di-AMP/oligoRNAs hydrolase)